MTNVSIFLALQYKNISDVRF